MPTEKTPIAVPASYQRMLTGVSYFHDWYLKDLYVSNTGKEIHEVSKNGYTTIQLEMCTGDNEISYLLMFINASALQVQMETAPNDVSLQILEDATHTTLNKMGKNKSIP